MTGTRYRLQRKEPFAMQNILGNASQPVHTFRWKDIAASDSREALEKCVKDWTNYRIEDTQLFETN